MSDLSNETKLNLILESVKKYNLTAYEIGKGTKISTFAIQKILKGETKNPNPKTLNIILDYLEENKEGVNYKENRSENVVNEPTESKYSNIDLNNYNKCLKKNIELAEEVIRLQRILIQNGIQF